MPPHNDAAARGDEPTPGQSDPKPPMGEQLHQLYADGRLLVEHELGFQKQRLKFVGQQSKSASKLFLVATTFLVGGLLALILGVLLALIPVLGAWGATFVVTTGSLVIAAVAFLLAISRVKSIRRVFTTNATQGSVRSDETEEKLG